MSTIRSWSRNHPVEPFVLFAVVFTLALAAFVTSPDTHSQEQMPEKYKLALYTAPTNSTGATRSNEAPVFGRRLKPVGLALNNDSGSVPAVDKLPPCDIHIVNKKIWYEHIELTCQKVWFPHEATPTYAWRPEVGLPCDAKHEGSGLVVSSADDSDWAKIQCTHTPDDDYGWVTIDEKVLARCLPDGSMPPGERACTDAPVEGTDPKKLPKPVFHPDPRYLWM